MRESKASISMLLQKPKVALLIQTSSEWSRQVIAGVAEYASQNGYWDFWIEPRGLYEDLRLPSEWLGDGVICRLTGAAMAEELAVRYLPTVNVSWRHVHSWRFPKVVSDEAACGKMAADYFIDGGWTHIAYVGPPLTLAYSDQLPTALRERLSRAKLDLHVFEPNKSARLSSVQDQQALIGDWLASLPKPVAILVWSTTIGYEISQIAASRGITVPDQIALLAVELDPLISSLAPIPIAYIDQSPRRVGIAAAELLSHLIKGGSPPEAPILIPPVRIAARLSVDAMFTDDRKVRSAVEFIRNNVSRAIQVNDVAEHVGMSRRSIESHFIKQLNKTPSTVIRRTKVSLAQHLLSETELRVQEVADRVGFFHLETFLRFFKRETGMTPTEYRMARTNASATVVTSDNT